MSSTMKDIVSRTNGELYIGVVGVVHDFGNIYFLKILEQRCSFFICI